VWLNASIDYVAQRCPKRGRRYLWYVCGRPRYVLLRRARRWFRGPYFAHGAATALRLDRHSLLSFQIGDEIGGQTQQDVSSALKSWTGWIKPTLKALSSSTDLKMPD
jgi:hypothetical protein